MSKHNEYRELIESIGGICIASKLGDVTAEDAISQISEKIIAHIAIGRVVATTPLFWDCECEDGHIRPRTFANCSRCGAKQDSQPDARVNEVLDWLDDDGDDDGDENQAAAVPEPADDAHLEAVHEDPFDIEETEADVMHENMSRIEGMDFWMNTAPDLNDDW